MSTEQMTQVARYQSLRDYLAVLRRYRLMILIITIIGAGAGLANALRETPVYQACSEVAFQDPTQDLTIVQLGGTTPQSPAQLAAVNAETATAPAVLQKVHSRLKTQLSPQALGHAVSTQVFVGSGLLQICANASSPRFAANLSNAVANQVVARDNRETRAKFTQLANSIRRKIAQLKPGPGGATPIQASFYQNELARLDALSSFAKTAQIERPAQPPSGPSSPNKGRDTALGAVLGLLLGIIAAFVRDAMDRRLRKPSDFESAFDYPVIGHVRKQSMGRTAYLSSNGSKEMDKLDLESFRILRRNLEFLDYGKGVRSVVVTSAVAEEGKTTVASSLALVLAAAGRQTLLVDCDLRRPDLAARMHVDPSPGISDYLAGTATPQEILRTVTFGEPASQNQGQNGTGIVHNVVCIPAGAATSRASELLGSRRFKEFLDQVTAKYDMVVFDSSPLLPVADTLEILPCMDAVIVCARESQTTRDQARAVTAALGRVPSRPTGIVATGMKPRGAEYEAYAYSYTYS